MGRPLRQSTGREERHGVPPLPGSERPLARARGEVGWYHGLFRPIGEGEAFFFWRCAMKEILRTRRLLLREMTEGDIPDLEEMLLDPEVMYAYPHTFTKRCV